MSTAAARRSGVAPELSRIGGITVARVAWSGPGGRPCLLRGLVEDDHPSALDLTLRESDAILFVMDVQPDQLRLGWDRLMAVGESARREGFELLDRPFGMQYHGSDRHPGFDAGQLDAWLGFPRDRVVCGVTPSTQADHEGGVIDRLAEQVRTRA
ncbi:hypothetical protein [Haloferula sargassicola]